MAMKGGGRKGFMFKRIKKKRCKLCSEKRRTLDYKDTDYLKNYITDRGKIIPRRVSGCCAKHQRVVTKAVKKSREAGSLPFSLD